MSQSRQPRGDELTRAAAWLDCPEAEVIARAHRWWFGAAPTAEMLDRLAAACVLHGESPPWVRQYIRHLGLPAAVRPRLGRLVVAASGLAAALVLLLAVQMQELPHGEATARLSCAGAGPGLAVLEQIAYDFAGRQAPPC